MASSARKIELDSIELDGIPADPRKAKTGRRERGAKIVSLQRKREASAPRISRMSRPLLGENRTFERELRAFPARLLGTLPCPTTLRLRVPGVDRVVAVATSADRVDNERASGAVVFDVLEWNAIVVAAEADRLWPADLREICGRKTSGPSVVLDAERALAGARVGASPEWSLGRVLDRVGAQLLDADC